jgi:hypothetical protein
MKKPRRQESKEPLLSTGELRRELEALIDRTVPLAVLYAKALEEGGWPPGGSGVHVSGGSPSDATVSALLSPEARDRRQDARRAVGWVKQAGVALRNAEKALRGELVDQPEKIDPRATMSQDDFDRRRQRMRVSAEHIRREEELRR